MHFRQFYLGCLAHASYFIASEGEAVVVDPQRDVRQYLEEAERIGAKIRYVFETHLHADFVSGHQELAAATGAEIVFGALAGAEYPHRAIRDGEMLRAGTLTFQAMETPGHTPEGISWLVTDEGDAAQPGKLLTGDTLFIGDVGRPDLAGAKGFSAEGMAGSLYDSLHGKILKLDDAVEVWPAHGAGSACGRNISAERSSTIGMQRRTNYALRPMPRDEFIALMTTDRAEPPPYFAMDVDLNRRGVAPLASKSAPPLTATEVRDRVAAGSTLLDVRDSASFGCGHVAGSINIGLGGQYASWCGSLLPLDRPVIIVADSEQQVDEALVRLGRVGIENVAGYLDGGVSGWSGMGFPVDTVPQIDVRELHDMLEQPLQIVDVRNPGEFSAGHVPGALNVPLGQLGRRLGEVDLKRKTIVICAGGYRSSAAASILQQGGVGDLANVIGGTSAWVNAGFEVAT
jgi:hydroxyacylglutathione hydrolase